MLENVCDVWPRHKAKKWCQFQWFEQKLSPSQNRFKGKFKESPSFGGWLGFPVIYTLESWEIFDNDYVTLFIKAWCPSQATRQEQNHLVTPRDADANADGSISTQWVPMGVGVASWGISHQFLMGKSGKLKEIMIFYNFYWILWADFPLLVLYHRVVQEAREINRGNHIRMIILWF